MHQFQPYPLDSLEINPFTKFDKEWAALTASHDGKLNTMTISWGGLGTIWNKPAATVYVRESRYTKEFLDHTTRFSLSFFEPKYHTSLRYFGAASGRVEDKIKNSGLYIDNYMGVPYFDEANFVIICRKMVSVPIPEAKFLDPTIKSSFYEDDDYHTMYIGEVLSVLAR